MPNFSQQDIEQIKNHGLTIDVINQQINDFKSGFAFADIMSPATIGDGIQEMLSPDFAEIFNKNKDNYKIVKFVPASGAATRMFKDLFEFLSSGIMNKTTQGVLDNLTDFAFYSDLKQFLPENATPKQIIEALITNRGLNYGAMPKGLLKFHKYNDENRTAVAEHLVEGAQYAATNNIVKIHFTVSPEHVSGFKDLLKILVPTYESKFGVKYDISMSTQKSETDTIAVNLDNTPFRNDDGSLLFRPAGHGALIENLNDIDADIIFIKNIDNVCPDGLRDDTILYKQMLAGLGIKIQREIFECLSALDSGMANLDKIKEFISKTLGIKMSNISDVRDVLNRPLRVCGMIKNTGEPGGGPFWVRSSDGAHTLQIIEPGQVAPENVHILKNGGYFNPVDLICFVRDYKGNKFNLTKYIDSKTGFISEKSKNGRPLRAMERPGLWNGAMAKWNTVFVAVPLSTFTPAKVVTDLINGGHKTNN